MLASDVDGLGKALECIQQSLSDIIMQKDSLALLDVFFSNFIKPDLLFVTPEAELPKLQYAITDNHLTDDELVIGTAACLTMLENEDDLDGTTLGNKVLDSCCFFYIVCVKKTLAKFPFSEQLFSDLIVLDPQHRMRVLQQ